MQLGHSVSKLGTSAVIDGSKLQITPLRHCVIPPPLSAVTAAFPCNITCLAFLNDSKAEVKILPKAPLPLAVLSHCSQQQMPPLYLYLPAMTGHHRIPMIL